MLRGTAGVIERNSAYMKRLGRVAALFLVAGVASAQTASTTTTTTHTKKKTKVTTRKPNTSAEIEALQEQMRAQQSQIDSLKSQVADKDKQISDSAEATATAQQAAAAAQSKADAASTSAQQAQDQVNTLNTTVTDLKGTTQGLQETVVTDQAKVQEAIESPLAIHYKGITVTPVAYFAFENVWRQRAVNADINTPFNAIPFPGANEGHVSELNFSGRQSRLGALFTGNAGNFKLSGYFEGDFLSAGVTSNSNQSNSYTLRQRQFWGKAETNSGFAVTGGQMWSLVTETGTSTDARTEKLPQAIDAQYVVGFSWVRQPGIRFQQRWGDVKTGAFTAAMSVEQAQTLSLSTQGPAPNALILQGPGQGGGLFNATANYSNNVAPDVVVKGTYDLAHAHFEIGGLARFMRSLYNPVTGVATGNVYSYDQTQQLKNTKVAGGVFGSARVSPSKFADVAFQFMAGDGVGRYGSSTLPDATIKSDGTLEPIRNYHGLFTLETHPTPKLDVYAYYGGEYDQRTVYANALGSLFGYGTPTTNDAGCYAVAPIAGAGAAGGSISAANCGSPTRYIQEGLIGATYRVVNSPKYGKLQYSVNYQYVQRNLWSGVGNATTPSGPRALDNMVFTSMRYYIP